ncbi:hypothetical protein [Frateuria soli]|uniref:hypothetical protein n=1 Tax=Frateuria soli TaxID=1542730 RepID=UPI001E2B3241|nr:hypothetical protein [Frateuria soli]UGB39124.1 hypothetical protein LQ771_04570 [Frateuria soli]
MNTNDDLDNLLALAERTPGWNFREYPPQRARLRGNCELIVVPPWLWRSRYRGPVGQTRPPVKLRRVV